MTEPMDYRIETRGSDGVWRPHVVVTGKAGVDYVMGYLVPALGAENVTYRPALDGVDYVVMDEDQ